MVATELTVIDANAGSFALVAEATADVSNGNKFLNDGRTCFIVSNEEASNALTAVITGNTDRYGRQALKSLSVTAGRCACSGFLPVDVFNDSSGYANVTYTGSGTAVRVFAVRMNQ